MKKNIFEALKNIVRRREPTPIQCIYGPPEMFGFKTDESEEDKGQTDTADEKYNDEN